MTEDERKEARTFTIELRSKGHLKNVSLDSDQKVFIEGSIGYLKRARFVEDIILEVVGSNGELRIDLGTKDLQKAEGSKKYREGER
ncbi:MAG TPA: hypothetical protein VMB46_01840 [Methanomassiliicoccales archaeon]|nr:hypothetical protein [Methanomassiliicoccales archaeon]